MDISYCEKPTNIASGIIIYYTHTLYISKGHSVELEKTLLLLLVLKVNYYLLYLLQSLLGFTLQVQLLEILNLQEIT